MRHEVFTFWTGANPLSANRSDALTTLQTSVGVPVRLVDDKILREMYLPQIGIELHPAYYCLNLAHRADYLRAMFMNFFGGGYADIKSNTESWKDCFEVLNSNDQAYAMGYTEVSRKGVAKIFKSSLKLDNALFEVAQDYVRYIILKKNYKKLVGCGAFIFKPNTPLTNLWWVELNQRLDSLHDDLKRYPSKLDPKEKPGKFYSGIESRYPVPWTYLLGDILHPLMLEFESNILHELPTPQFDNYE